jgi:hypothetical protein
MNTQQFSTATVREDVKICKCNKRDRECNCNITRRTVAALATPKVISLWKAGVMISVHPNSVLDLIGFGFGNSNLNGNKGHKDRIRISKCGFRLQKKEICTSKIHQHRKIKHNIQIQF